MSTRAAPPPSMPPGWFVHTFWRVHRVLHRVSGGRFLWTPASKRGWGALSLTVPGRRSGRARTVILGYLEDGPDLVVLAMNGWEDGDPAWWLNLQAHPDAEVRLKGEPPRRMHAREAVGAERDRLWDQWLALDDGTEWFADHRATATPVVVLEPAGRESQDGRSRG